MDRYLSLQAFVRVADAASFSGAARTMGLSKAVVSERVRHLETLLRAQLFYRTTRNVRLSEAGTDLLPEARALVHRLGDLENTAPDGNADLAGRLRIASVIDFGISHVGPAVSVFAALHPQLQVELVVSDRVVNPMQEGFDIAIHFRRMEVPGLVALPLLDVKNILVAAPGWLERAPPLAHATDLSQHRCVGYAAQTTTDPWDTGLWALNGPDTTERFPIRLSMVTNSGHVLKRFVCDGQGIAVLPLERVAEELRAGTLVHVLPALRPETLQLFGIVPEAQVEQKKLQALVSALKQHFSVSAHQE